MTEVQEVEEVGTDTVLHLLVQMVAEGLSSAGLPITLNVRGTTVTGNLVSRDSWAEAVTACGTSSVIRGTGSDPQAIGEYFQEMFRETDLQRKEDEPIIYAYIHLVNARMATPFGFVPTGRGVPWRGRLSEVSGWCLGTLQSP